MKNALSFLLGFAGTLLLLFLVTAQLNGSKEDFELQLPLSIAKEPLLISSCGQSTDAYLMQDLLTDLRMNHQFIPQATSEDLTEMATLILTVGYSPTGLKMLDQSFDDELARVKTLVAAAEKSNIPIIAVYLGGGSAHHAENQRLFEALSPYVDRFITLNKGVLSAAIQASGKDVVTISKLKDLKAVIISSLR